MPLAYSQDTLRILRPLQKALLGAPKIKQPPAAFVSVCWEDFLVCRPGHTTRQCMCKAMRAPAEYKSASGRICCSVCPTMGTTKFHI